MSVVLPIQPDDRFRILTASAGQTVLAIGFPWQDDNDIDLLKADVDGDWIPLSRPADFNLSGVGNPSGGSATLVAPAAAGDKFLVLGSAVLARLSAVTRDGKFSSKIIDDELDRNRLIQQEHGRDIKRALKAEYGETGLTVAALSEGAILMRSGNRIVDGPDGQAIADAADNAAAAAASATQANQSAVAALAAANAGFVFDTRAAAAAANIPAPLDFVRTSGFHTAGDLGAATYRRVLVEPSHAGKFQSADGAWWEIAEPILNVVMFGADATGSLTSSVAIQSLHDTVADGDVVVIPDGVYNITAGVVGSKRLVWMVYGRLLQTTFNWPDALTGTIIEMGRRSFANGVTEAVVSRSTSFGEGLDTGGDSIDYYAEDFEDDIKAFPGRVHGRAVYMRTKAGFTGIRQAFGTQYHHEEPSGNAPGEGAHYTAFQSGAFVYTHDNGTDPSSDVTSQGSFFGGSSFAEAKSGATALKNLTSWEFNTVSLAGSSVWYRSGIQIAGGGQVRGSVHDYGIAVSMLDYPGGLTWRAGIHFGDENGIMPLGADSAVMKMDLNTILTGFDFGTTTVTDAIIKEVNNRMETSSLQLLAPNHSLLIGQRNAVNAPRQYFCSSGNTTPDVTLVASGGTVTTNQGTLALSAAEFATGCVVRPSTDNAHNLGGASFRWKDAYFVNAPTVTSDAKMKRDVADIDPALARRMMKALRPVTFVWKDDDVPAVTETRKVMRQKVNKIVEEKEVERVEFRDGKAVLMKAVENVQRDDPVFDELPVVDENGNPVMRTIRRKIGERPVVVRRRIKIGGKVEMVTEEILDGDGNPRMEAVWKEDLVQRVERRPVMEEVEEVIDIAPAYSKKNVRTHWGFIAQEVETALAQCGLTTNDFAGFVYDGESDTYGLRMEQFIAIMWAAMRDDLNAVGDGA